MDTLSSVQAGLLTESRYACCKVFCETPQIFFAWHSWSKIKTKTRKCPYKYSKYHRSQLTISIIAVKKTNNLCLQSHFFRNSPQTKFDQLGKLGLYKIL